MKHFVSACLFTVSIFLSLPCTAHATALGDAISSYNSSAVLLQATWESFPDEQDTSFEDCKVWVLALEDFLALLGPDPQAADTAWQEHIDAYDAMVNNATDCRQHT